MIALRGIGLTFLLLALGSWAWSRSGEGSAKAPVPARTPVEALQQELLQKNLGQAGDPALGARFHDISEKHFHGSLPAVPVRWEPRLAEVGPLAARAFTLEGMFGKTSTRSVILLNPDLADDDPALTRALCHEMVHAYLSSIGDSSTEHGPAFQNLLERLAREGAFVGIPASEDGRTRLRAWLDAESARLDWERQDMERAGAEIDREREAIESAFADLDARLAAARAGTGAWPGADEARALSARRDNYNERAMAANARVQSNRQDLDHFNKEVERYNLMLVYPDGIDEQALRKQKNGSG